MVEFNVPLFPPKNASNLIVPSLPAKKEKSAYLLRAMGWRQAMADGAKTTMISIYPYYATVNRLLPRDKGAAP